MSGNDHRRSSRSGGIAVAVVLAIVGGRYHVVMRVESANVIIECIEGDITDQSGFDAVMNAANAELLPGGGLAGAIHHVAGPELEQACRPLAPIRPGEAVITETYNLPNRYVIHCLGPVYGYDEPSDELLADCYREVLRLAEENEIASIAFPAISTGAFGYPMREAALISMRTIREVKPTLKQVQHIRFALWGNEALEAHMEAVSQVFDS